VSVRCVCCRAGPARGRIAACPESFTGQYLKKLLK